MDTILADNTDTAIFMVINLGVLLLFVIGVLEARSGYNRIKNRKGRIVKNWFGLIAGLILSGWALFLLIVIIYNFFYKYTY